MPARNYFCIQVVATPIISTYNLLVKGPARAEICRVLAKPQDEMNRGSLPNY